MSRNGPKKSVSNTRRTSGSGVDSTDPKPTSPALLTSAWSRGPARGSGPVGAEHDDGRGRASDGETEHDDGPDQPVPALLAARRQAERGGVLPEVARSRGFLLGAERLGH